MGTPGRGTDERRCAVRVTGVVQGVGFRPFVHHLATELGLTGHVGNDAAGVFIEVLGPTRAVEEFLQRLSAEAPPMAAIDTVTVTDLPTTDAGSQFEPLDRSDRLPAPFRIVPSPGDAGTQGSSAPSAPPVASTTGATSIPADSAVCSDCLAELRDPADRRFGYPFIACTHCGPRFTITTGLPYDRDRTTMVDFPLCPDCRAEYEDPRSRRFHAQPTACPRCGPQLSMPVTDLVAALAEGRIVAIKGIGGYHLACDARDPEAVARLRARKRRGDKPFAVMVRDLPTARTIAAIGPLETELLTSAARPIVLVASVDASLQRSVAPGTNLLGVMLPYAPLHHLMFDAGAPVVLVMTSGNLSDEPICIDPEEAEQRLAGIADVFCHHERRIHVACDDSVVRIVAGQPQPVRRSRGYAPLPVALPLTSGPLVAVGGELKATAAVAAGRRAWLTQHVGDTENLETLDMLARSIDTLAALQQVTPAAVVSDAHPGYLSHGWAARRGRALGIPHLVVQHHHAHLASLLAEHAIDPGDPVLGVVLDGTGYGADATIWGGELLLGSYAAVDRVGHLRPVLLPGGDAAIRVPARTAVAHLAAAGLPAAGSAPAEALGESSLRLLGQMLASGSHCVPTTSMGRLFDAVASLLDVRHQVDYEAQAAIELEARGARAGADWAAWPAATLTQAEAGGPLILDPGPWIARALADHAAGVPVPESARAFHVAVADSLTQACLAIRAERGVGTVGLTGGVFANAILTKACVEQLAEAGFTVLTHRVVPPNDGGLALGQVAVAAAGGAVPAGAVAAARPARTPTAR